MSTRPRGAKPHYDSSYTSLSINRRAYIFLSNLDPPPHTNMNPLCDMVFTMTADAVHDRQWECLQNKLDARVKRGEHLS